MDMVDHIYRYPVTISNPLFEMVNAMLNQLDCNEKIKKEKRKYKKGQQQQQQQYNNNYTKNTKIAIHSKW